MFYLQIKIILPERRTYETTTINGSISSNVGVCVLSSMLSTTITHTSLFSMLTVGKLIVYNQNTINTVPKNKNYHLATDLSYIFILWYYAFYFIFLCQNLMSSKAFTAGQNSIANTVFVLYIQTRAWYVVHGLKHSVLSDHKSKYRTVTP